MAFLSLCLFFVAAFATPSYQKQLSGATKQLMAMHTSFRANQARHMELQDDDACLGAWTSVIAFQDNSECAQYLGDVSLLWDNATANAVIQGYCDATNGPSCADRFATILENVTVQCAGAQYTNEIRNFQVVVKIPCIRDSNDNLCFNVFRHIPSVFDQALTPANLDSICVPCTGLILAEMKKIAPADFLLTWAYIDLACYKLNGQYCMPEFQLFIAQQESKPEESSDLPTPQQLDSICSPCIQTILFRFVVLQKLLNISESDAEEATLALAVSAFACQKDWNNQYCISQFSTYDYSQLAPCSILATQPNTCPGSQCQKALQGFRAHFGCCLGVWFDFATFMCHQEPDNCIFPVAPSAMKSLVENTCQVNIPESCARQKILLALVVAGLDPVWASAHQDDLKAAIQAAVAYQLAIDAALVNVEIGTHSTQGKHHLFANDGSVPVSVTITTNSDSQTSIGVSNTKDFELSILGSKLPAAAVADPSTGVTTQLSQVQTVGSGNGATTLSTSLLLLASLFLAVVGMY